jgi:hypothetical protein
MSAGDINVPIVFRGPNGAAAGVGAQHSQDFSAWYASVRSSARASRAAACAPAAPPARRLSPAHRRAARPAAALPARRCPA